MFLRQAKEKYLTSILKITKEDKQRILTVFKEMKEQPKFGKTWTEFDIADLTGIFQQTAFEEFLIVRLFQRFQGEFSVFDIKSAINSQ